jgi:agmatine/peptidylarginine deiminase
VVIAIALAFWLGRTMGHLPAEPESPPAEFELAPGNQGATFRFSPPRPLKRLITEWEPQRALVMTMSFAESMAANDITLFQIQMLEIAHRYNDILVFSDHEQAQAHAYFLSRIREHPQADSILARTKFIDSRNLMRWTRDFGPIFGLDRQNQLVGLDYVYRNLNRDLEEAVHRNTDSFRRFVTHHGDAMPADLAAEIEQRYNLPVNLVRPPLVLEGGDFVHDGRGNVFISTQTLVQNGGNRAALAELFRLYFGAKKMHVLQALPGSTVNHLDMILKFVRDRTVILPDFQSDPAADRFNPYRTDLVERVNQVLANNERYLREHFPELRIIKMPMPPILFSEPEEILAEAVNEFIQVIAVARGVVSMEQMEQLHAESLPALRPKVEEIIRQDLGGAFDLETPAGFNAVLRAYGHAPLEKLFDMHAEQITRYRSYLNSVFLHNPDGKHGFVVPRFTSPQPDKQQRLRSWEREVEAAYREAWPEAAIHWINCDSLISDSGFVHCVTLTVPAQPPSP